MPLYEYQCKTCESKFEVLQGINEANDELACPDCNSLNTTKIFSLFASVGNGRAAACDTGST